MGESHAVTALLRERRQVAGVIEGLTQELNRQTVLLAHIDALLEHFGHDTPERVKPRRPPTAGVFAKGEIYRAILAQLRKADAPLRAREIAKGICRDRGWPADDNPWLSAMTEKVSRALTRLKAKGRVERERAGMECFWRVAAK